jgi:ubiquinone/menaquinone biosynthesis C-methylase UbiE
MGSKVIQAELWNRSAHDWASLQEKTSLPCYEYILEKLPVMAGENLLDAGCGSGYFSQLAHRRGARVTGLDASEKLIEEAKKREPGLSFICGDIESLPFPDKSFQSVCALNSIQYAENTSDALLELRRVLTEKGKLVTMIWGNKEDCQAFAYLKALGSCMPPSPGSGGPFLLTENHMLQDKLKDAGFKLLHEIDLPCSMNYPDLNIAMRGLLSAGPSSKAIGYSSYEKVYEAVSGALKPYIQNDGSVRLENKFRIVFSEKAAT